MTGLTERKVVDFEDYELLDKDIDYSKVNKIIDKERDNTLNILKEMFNVVD